MTHRKIYTSLVALALAASPAMVHAQSLKWPQITSLNKPWTRWWWEGSAVTKSGLDSAMDKYARAGLGGLEITPIYGVKGTESQFIPFLTPKWMEMLDYTVAKAGKLNLGIDMATGTGWPFGGPWVKPEDASKNINFKTYDLKSGQRLSETVSFHQEPFVRTANGKQVSAASLSYPVATNKDLQGLALDQVKYDKELAPSLVMGYSDNGDTVDLTSKVKAGKLEWEAPAGNWTVYALFQGSHGKMVERAAPGGEGEAIDHFSRQALDRYLAHFTQAFKGHESSKIRSFFNDSYEVDDARGQANWTPQFLKDFRLRRGYELQRYLPALFQKADADLNRRVLFDYRLTVSELLLDNFTKPWHSWAKGRGALIRNQSHGSPSNILDLYAAIDIPETEGTDLLRFKFATSAANVNGKPLASSESATWLNEHFQSSLGDVKLALDKYFAGGVNHIFYHGTNYSPPGETWPGWLFYAAVHFTPANSFWRDFDALNNYVARTQSFLQQGKPDNDVLVYFPINDRFNVAGNAMLHHFDGMEGFEKTEFNASAEKMLEQGYAFDFISDLQITKLQNAGKSLQTGGVNYQTLLIADTKYMTPVLLQKLITLARNGATILFYNNYPTEVPGLSKLAANEKLVSQLNGQVKFGSAKTDGISQALIGKGAFIQGKNLDALLEFANIRREKIEEKGLLFVRRKTAEGTLYFITNEGKTAFDGWLPLASKFKGAALYDAMQQRSGKAKISGDSVYLQLPMGESIIIQCSAAPVTADLFPYEKVTGKAIALTAAWEIKFIDGGPTLPATSTQQTLGTWTAIGGNDTKIFSGTAQYSTSLPKPAIQSAAWLLDLGNVGESAEVLLNNKSLGKLLGPSYQIVIPTSLLKDANLLQVNVTNGMANRIADLDKRGVEWKKFYNVNFPSRLPANRNANGIFDASAWTPKPSGLMGPVTITPISIER